MNDIEFGYIKLKIEPVMIARGLSRTKLTQLAQLQRKQLNKLLDGTALRIDFEVLARICNALDCKIEDILEYVPRNEDK